MFSRNPSIRFNSAPPTALVKGTPVSLSAHFAYNQKNVGQGNQTACFREIKFQIKQLSNESGFSNVLLSSQESPVSRTNHPHNDILLHLC